MRYNYMFTMYYMWECSRYCILETTPTRPHLLSVLYVYLCIVSMYYVQTYFLLYCPTVNSRVVRRHVDVYASSNEFSPFGVQILTIPNSSMNGSVVSLTVTVVDDEIVENDEGLRISVNPGNQYQVTNEQAGTVVLTIMDNDGKCMYNVYKTLLIMDKLCPGDVSL